MRNVAAYTKLDASYPGFVNVTRNSDNTVSLLVRADPMNGNCGQDAKVTLSAVEFADFMKELNSACADW